MRGVRLISFRDEVTGELGLGIKGHTDGETLLSDREGSLLAHDIVEHQNGFARIGEPDDELEAIGAIWQVRARHGTLLNEQRYWRCLYDVISGDIVSVATDYRGMENMRWDPYVGQYRTREHRCDDDFLEILSKARPIIEAEMRHDENPFPMEAFMDNALHLMRMGYRKAERRFGDGYKGADTYQAIKGAIRPHAQHVDYEGQEYVLAFGDGRATCREIHSEAW